MPDQTVDAVEHLDAAQLAESGIAGLILDLDDTLVCAADTHLESSVCQWLEEARLHLKVVILSNNHRLHRVAPIADRLSVPYIWRAFKPLQAGFRRALAVLDLPASQVAVVGDQLFTDVLGGRRLGARTILVTSRSPRERKWARRLMRRAERAVLARLLHTPVEIRSDLSPCRASDHAS